MANKINIICGKFNTASLVLSIAAFCFFATILIPSVSRAQQNEETDRLIKARTEAFFEQLQKNDFETERTYMADQFASMATSEKWKEFREEEIAKQGTVTKYKAHKLTYYQRDNLLVAVDFSAKSAKPGVFICGYLLWEVTNEDDIGLGRIEQNLVSESVFKKMPVNEAAQLMANWRCPTPMIESLLKVTLNRT